MRTLTGHRRAALFGVVAAAGTATLLAVGIGAPATVIAAAECGTDASPPCPVVERLDPGLFQGAPRGPVTVRIVGSVLDGVAVVVLEPAGKEVRISGRDATSISVVIPDGVLTAGSTNRLGLRLAGQDGDAVTTPAMAVIDPVAANPARSLAPPPVAVDTPPNPAVAGPAPAVTTSAPPAAPGAGFGRVILFLLLGFVLGGWGVYLIAERTGLLYEVEWFCERRDQREHARALQQIGCHLTDLWESGGDVVLAGTRVDPVSEARAAGRPRPSHAYLDALQTALLAAIDAARVAATGNPDQLVLVRVPDGEFAQAAPTAGPHADAAPAPSLASAIVRPGGSPWSIRAQSKPLGAPQRLRTPPI